MVNTQDRKWIDQASYATLLRYWQFGSVGCRLLSGETRTYFWRVMKRKQTGVGHPGFAKTSKQGGVEPPRESLVVR